jgi:hypothetical protein
MLQMTQPPAPVDLEGLHVLTVKSSQANWVGEFGGNESNPKMRKNKERDY